MVSETERELSRRIFRQVRSISSKKRDELFNDNEEIDEFFARSDDQRQNVALVHEGEASKQERNARIHIGEASGPAPLTP
jgi:hypothetical protein